MHKFAKQIMDCVKAHVDGIGIENFEGQNLDDLKDWTEIAKNIVCFDKDYNIVEAMKKSEDNEDIMRMLEQYEDYPERRYYNEYRYSNGRFAPKGRGTRRGYVEPPYYHQMPEDYHEWERMPEYDRMRDLDRMSAVFDFHKRKFSKIIFRRAPQKIFRNFFVPPWGGVFGVKIPFSRILKNV